MAVGVEGKVCGICGKPATRFMFACFLCGSEDCLSTARTERSGPAGHMGKKEWAGAPVAFTRQDGDA